jgi:hypothetical protein
VVAKIFRYALPLTLRFCGDPCHARGSPQITGADHTRLWCPDRATPAARGRSAAAPGARRPSTPWSPRGDRPPACMQTVQPPAPPAWDRRCLQGLDGDGSASTCRGVEAGLHGGADGLAGGRVGAERPMVVQLEMARRRRPPTAPSSPVVSTTWPAAGGRRNDDQ